MLQESLLVFQLLAWASLFVSLWVRDKDNDLYVMGPIFATILFFMVGLSAGVTEIQYCEYQEGPGTPDNFSCHTEIHSDIAVASSHSWIGYFLAAFSIIRIFLFSKHVMGS